MGKTGDGKKAVASRSRGTEEQGSPTPNSWQLSRQRQPDRVEGRKPKPACASSRLDFAAPTKERMSSRQASKLQPLIYVRYLDHVVYSRSSALAMKPQIREAVGWLIYECQDYITLAWDRDAEPPTIRGGDIKASGLVLLKTDILETKKIA